MAAGFSLKAIVLAATALTNIHPGAGRSPGVVDLPVFRDEMGFPGVPSSEVKGALKTLLARKQNCIKSDGEIDCDKGKIVCCLLGGERGQASEGASALAINVAPGLLFVPAPSSELRVAYITSPSRLAMAADALRAAGRGGEASKLEDAASASSGCKDSDSEVLTASVRGSVRLGPFRLRASRSDEVVEAARILDGVFGGLSALYRAHRIGEGLVVPCSERAAKRLFESMLLRMTRVRLNRETKTVERGALWTEEYIPRGSGFLIAVVETGFTNVFCHGVGDPLSDFVKLTGKEFYMVVGGKETVGGGLVKVRVV